MKTPLTMKVSLNDAKMWATPKTCSPGWTVGPRVILSSLGSLAFFLDCKAIHKSHVISNYMCNAANSYNTKVQKTTRGARIIYGQQTLTSSELIDMNSVSLEIQDFRNRETTANYKVHKHYFFPCNITYDSWKTRKLNLHSKKGLSFYKLENFDPHVTTFSKYNLFKNTNNSILTIGCSCGFHIQFSLKP